MTKKEYLNTMFYVAYHNVDMGREVKKFMRENFPTMLDNRHAQAIFSFCDTISERGIDNTHPALLGMLCEAWKQFLNEVES